MGQIAFVFSGQGDQYPDMGRALYETYPAARRVFDQCDAIRPGTAAQCFGGTAEELKETANTQPCLYAMELAAAEVLREKGTVPDAVAGFSLGEVTAAAFAGICDAQTGFSLVCRRGELMQREAEKHDTAMAAVVKLSPETVQTLCSGHPGLYPVNFNCPGQITVSGLTEQMSAFSGEVKAAGGRCIPLKVKGAFHSPFMQPAADAFADDLAKASLGKGIIPLYSNVTAEAYDGDPATLLAKQISSPVQWERLIRHCCGLFLRTKEGCIINISSVSGLMGNPGQCNYAASNAHFARLCRRNGLVFIGPDPDSMERLSDKAVLKELIRTTGLTVIPGTKALTSIGEAKALAEKIGYPVMLKACAGGGGRGIRLIRREEELEENWHQATAEALSAFGDGSVYLEKYVYPARHVELQILADEFGNAVCLGERDCSLQQRNQKLIEETPSPAVSTGQRKKLMALAVDAVKRLRYVGAGTLEFLLDKDGNFWFMEMNVRLQVEHCVTEMLTGFDLVKWQMANVFRSAGLKRGDRVMLVLKRHYEYWFAVIALHKLGVTVIPATHMLTVSDYVYRIRMAKVNAVVCTSYGDVPEKLLTAVKEADSLCILWSVRKEIPGFRNLTAEAEAAADTLERVPTQVTDPMLLYFTSGTTGYPKGVIHDFSYPLAHIITAKYWQQAQDGGLHFTVAETGWAKASWGKLYGQWLVGSAVMVYDFDNFEPKQLCGIINRYGVTSFCAPPTVYRYLVRKGIPDMPSLKHASTAGEILAPEVFRKFSQRTGLELCEGYGQTETTLLMANFKGMQAVEGSMGTISPLYHIELRGKDGKPVPDGEIGEVVILPPENGKQIGVFSGYLDNEEQYRYVWRGGVYYTGDAAYRDETGRYWFHGRFDDIIKTGGYRVGPYEVENVLMEHPAVVECSVVGVPDKLRGQAIKAFIVLGNREPSPELEKEIRDFCNARLAEYKWVRLIEFVSEMPKTISGKIRKTELRAAI